MLKQFTILFFLVLFFSCRSKPTKEIENVSQISIVDSLNKYSCLDRLVEFQTFRLFAAEINGQKVGLVQISDSTTSVYKKTNDKWTPTDTLNCSISKISKIDINGDNYIDLIITYSITGSGGNSENNCLLYYPTKKKYMHNKYFDLPNIHFDKKKNMVFSAWWSGATKPQEKMSYRISGDSLTFIEGVIYQPYLNLQLKKGRVEFYMVQGNSRIVKRRIEGSSEKLLKIFNEALWNTNIE